MDDKKIELTMKGVKVSIKSDCKWIRSAFTTYGNLDLVECIDTIFEKGIISGSILQSYYRGESAAKRTANDFDIFIALDQKFVEKFKKLLLTHVDTEIEMQNIGLNAKYGTDDTREVFKFEIGKIQKRLINIIFVEDLWNPIDLVETFDFEICNWFYKFNTNEIYMSNKCLELLENVELDWNEIYKRKINECLKNYEFYSSDTDLLNALYSKETIKERLEEIDTFFNMVKKRLENYITNKKFVPSPEMHITLEKIKEKLGNTWWK